MGTSALPSKRTFMLANPFSWKKTKNFICRIPGMDATLCSSTKDAKAICCVGSVMLTAVFIPFILVALYCYIQYSKEGGDNE